MSQWTLTRLCVLAPPAMRFNALHRADLKHTLQRSAVRFKHSSPSLVAPHFFDRVLSHGNRPALFTSPAPSSDRWTYAQLLARALELRDVLTQAMPRSNSSAAPRVAYLGSRGPSYVTMQWATWLAGGVAVPLYPAHPVDELQYIMEDAEASVLIVSDDFSSPTHPHLVQFISSVKEKGKAAVVTHTRPTAPRLLDDNHLHQHEDSVRKWLGTCVFEHTGAQIVYTSGTTGRPKGVVTTHAGLTAQIHDVVSAWEMTERDHLLHFLPLHHVHGILNNLLCVHYAGGSLEFLGAAKPDVIWSQLAKQRETKVSMLMAVPTVYMNLLEEIERSRQQTTATYDVDAAVAGARHLRVAISGSMACPVSILNRWEALTGLRLLERYGMTELGMVLTNPLHGDRHLGYVGQPFPSVSVRLVDPDTDDEISIESEQEGELRVRGPSVFKEYWRKPDATAKEFDRDGWFKTGDIAQYSVVNKSFRIRGRASADILKSGGYKISALDVERVLLGHPQVHECAVFGIPDEKWGQVVAAVLRTSLGSVDQEALQPSLREFLKEHLADYAVPRKFFIVDDIPKNAMGKVNKKSLATLFK